MPGQGDGMSDAKHTPAPWEHDGKGSLFIAEAHRTVEPVCCGAVLPTGECCGNAVAGEGEPEWEFTEIGRMLPEDAERARVCVNACKGIDAANLEAVPYASLRALNEELAEALEPFADIGVWLFALDIPDDTPLVTVSLLNGAECHLTRGMFKAAHLARAKGGSDAR